MDIFQQTESVHRHFPRFMTDGELSAYFGLSLRALHRLRLAPGFPRRDSLIGKTDSKAVDYYFNQRAGLAALQSSGMAYVDGEEDFSGA